MTVSEAGRKGGKARAAKLSEHRRKEIARLGYLASPISKSVTRLDNRAGKIHEFPWPDDIIHPDTYSALGDKYKKKMACRLVQTAMNRLGLRPPLNCSNCTLPGYSRIFAHHDNYSQPMRVRFLCSNCHISWHRLSPSSKSEANSRSNEKITENKVEESSCA